MNIQGIATESHCFSIPSRYQSHRAWKKQINQQAKILIEILLEEETVQDCAKPIQSVKTDQFKSIKSVWIGFFMPFRLVRLFLI